MGTNRGSAYIDLDDDEYEAVKLLVACEGAMEPEGYPDDSVSAMADEYEALAQRLVERYKALLPNQPLTDEQWRRVVVAHLEDDMQNAIDYLK